MRLTHKLAVVALLGIFLFLAVSSSAELSYVAGEPEHIFIGYTYLTTGNTINPAGHHILTQMLSAVPLLFLNIDYPDYSAIQNPRDFGLFEFMHYGNNDEDAITFWARVPMVLLGTLLGFFVFLWARRSYGFKAGLLALVLYVFSTTVLANTILVLHDIAVATFFFITVYCLWRYTQRQSWRWIAATGICLGLALLTKIIAVYLLPVMFIILILFLFSGNELVLPKRVPAFVNNKNICRLFMLLVVLTAIGAVTFFAFYAREVHPIYTSDDPMYLNAPEERSLERLDKLVNELPIKNTRIQSAVKYVLTSVPVPAPHVFQGLYYLKNCVTLGFEDRLLGDYPPASSLKGAYFLLAFLIKTQIPLLCLLVLAVCLFSKTRHPKIFNELVLIMPVAVLFLAMMSFRIYGGIRYLLPAYPFLFVFVSKLANYKPAAKKLWHLFLVVLLAWYVASALLVHPNYLSYYNELAGGSENGYKYFISFDYDLGQNIKGLREWVRDNNITTVLTNTSKYYSINERGINITHLPGQIPTAGIIALGVRDLYGPLKRDEEKFRWLRENFTPIHKIGYSIWAYNITEADLTRAIQ